MCTASIVGLRVGRQRANLAHRSWPVFRATVCHLGHRLLVFSDIACLGHRAFGHRLSRTLHSRTSPTILNCPPWPHTPRRDGRYLACWCQVMSSPDAGQMSVIAIFQANGYDDDQDRG